MKIPEKVTVTANEREYSISKTVWDHYCEMHPVRTLDSFDHLIQLNFLIPNEDITSLKIEQMIMEEYDFVSHLDETVKKARELYEDSLQSKI